MKFRLTPKFWEDFNRLSEVDQQAVFNAKETFQLALQGDPQWFRYHRIKRMVSYPGIWEGHVKINLVFTFDYGQTDEGEKICNIRRVGSHDVYNRP